MTTERYRAYLEALDQVDRVVDDSPGADLLRELTQDLLLCRDPVEGQRLLEQTAITATDMTATGALSRDGSIYLLNAAIACGPTELSVGWPEAPSLVA